MKVAYPCPSLCNPRDYTVDGILQSRILERVAFPFSRGSSQPRNRSLVSHIAGGFFTSLVTREAIYPYLKINQPTCNSYVQKVQKTATYKKSYKIDLGFTMINKKH